jgi:Uncharacterised nucleotidyltransferase
VTPVSLGSVLPVPDALALALAALRSYPAPAPEAFEEACESLACRPELSEVLGEAYRRNLLHVCLCAYRDAIERDERAAMWLEVEPVAAAVLERQRRDLVEALDAADLAQLPIALPKGLAHALDLYPHQPVLMADVDVLIRERDREAMAELLTALGFRRGLALHDGAFLRASTSTIAAVEASVPHYGELHPFSKVHRFEELEPHRAFLASHLASSFVLTPQGIYRLGTFDVHYSLNPMSNGNPLGDRPQEAYWWRESRRLPIGERDAVALSYDVLAIMLPYRLYHELHSLGGRSLKPLGDLVALLRLREIDFDRLVGTAIELGAVRPALFYVYRFLAQFCRVAIPDEVLAALRSPSEQSFYADWGDIWPAALGIRALFDLNVELN